MHIDLRLVELPWTEQISKKVYKCKITWFILIGIAQILDIVNYCLGNRRRMSTFSTNVTAKVTLYSSTIYHGLNAMI